MVAVLSGLAVLAACGSSDREPEKQAAKAPPRTAAEPPSPTYNDSYFKAAFTEHDMPSTVPAGAAFELHLVVENQGDGTWPAAGDTKIGYDWMDENGEALAGMAGRALLSMQVLPGGKLPLVLSVRTPPRPGSYNFVLDMLVEKVAWFHSKGSRRLEVPVTVK
jgi:hypothetical protein